MFGQIAYMKGVVYVDKPILFERSLKVDLYVAFSTKIVEALHWQCALKYSQPEAYSHHLLHIINSRLAQ